MPECLICYESLSPKNLCTTDACDHSFCSKCLLKWSKEGNYCPFDRIRFKKIIIEGKSYIVKRPKRKRHRRITYDFTYYCEICSAPDLTTPLVLCDSCDLGYHIKCLDPPLTEIPSGSWYCETCINVEKKLSNNTDKNKTIFATSSNTRNTQNLQCHPMKELKIVVKKLTLNDLFTFSSKKEESLCQNCTQTSEKNEETLHQNSIQSFANEINLRSKKRAKTSEKIKPSVIENKDEPKLLSIKDMHKIKILADGTLYLDL